MGSFRVFGILMLVASTVSFASLHGVAEDRPDRIKTPIDFDSEIMPLLTRYGCNTGACHGAASGRGGFKLSLLGSDAAADYDTITRALEGRRVNRLRATRSLLLLKPSEQLEHEGGLIFEEESAPFQKLQAWIEQGAKRTAGARRLVSVKTLPDNVVLDHPGQSIPFSVLATFDGHGPTETDVTDWAVLTPGDAEAVTLDLQARRLTAHRAGVHIVIARFMDRVLPMRITVPMHTLANAEVGAEAFDNQASSMESTAIDEFIDEQLRQLQIPRSPLADEHAFLRRVTLDLCGRLPTLAEIKAFESDPRPDRRANTIRDLLDTPAFADYWALKWANILRIDAGQLQAEGAEAYHRWLADQIHQDTPWNQVARELLLSVGDSFEVGPANFSRFGSRPGDLAEHVSRSLMGVRLQCANCHDHPLDHWTQDDYHGLSAVFARLTRGRMVAVAQRGEVTHPLTRQAAVPRIPGERFIAPEEDARRAIADWLTNHSNRYLPRVTVNRLWRELMGRGLVEPVDDLRATNPATHPELMDWLANDFADHGYRLKQTIGKICNSQAYQRQSEPVRGNEADTQFYSHKLSRPLEAEAVADAIGDVTGVPLDRERANPSRVVKMTNNRAESRVLDLLGRCDRSNDCAASIASAESLTRALHLINGPLLQERVSAPEGTLTTLLEQSDDDRWVLDQLFLLTLTRPAASATPLWQTELDRAAGLDVAARRAFFEDVLWGILASQAFVTNH